MFEVISDMMAHCYDCYMHWSLQYAKKMNCALMFIIGNHYGRKWVSDLLQSEPCKICLKWFLI